MDPHRRGIDRHQPVQFTGRVGVGLRPPTAEWGLMMTELLPYHAEAPVALLAPAACLFLLVLGLQLLAGRRADP